MAELSIEDSDVVIRFGPLETAFVWHRHLRVPIDCVRMVALEPEPMKGMSLVRFPGLGVPGYMCYGAHWWNGKRELAAVNAHVTAVVMDIEHAFWDRVAVSTPRAAELAADLAGIIMARGPGGCPPKR
ncbi:MAG TPA: hypothetical protein VFN61_15290 [Acidimicrobiales bacterium]|nr:hypothetical protein [Acidimicrobiales bacterium]